ncbi:hypothetical protein [Natrialba swarupiae]|uniref:Nucleotidyltransferase family protein n=1 Tax=Natrialba swarupiae TaxID=2448032 RepID=A0A5D5ARD0_9EURY|nr:hypothetical protein [Natrialba swarupiae]TYT62010.1 hypothetical protein FYC77_11100 [Natrialba swarupiae]
MTLKQSKNSSQGIRYFDDLKKYLESVQLSTEDVCIVGSAVLADFGLRENGDIDLAIDPYERGAVDFDSTPKNIDVSVEKYSWLGVTDKELVHDETYHYTTNGIKIVKPEIELSFKHRRLWEKDQRDIELLEQRFLGADDYEWDWSLFSYEFYPDFFDKRGLPESKKKDYSLIAEAEVTLREEGVVATARAGFGLISRKLGISTPKFVGSRTRGKSDKSGDETLYFVIWPTVSDYFDSIVDRLDSELGVVSVEIMNLGDEVGQFVDDMYAVNESERLIEYKKYKINDDGDNVVIVGTEPPVNEYGEIDEDQLSSLKNKIRREYYPYVSKDSFHNIFHGPDSLDENEWITDVLSEYQ